MTGYNEATPIVPLGDVFGLGCQISIKRDDLIPFCFGGNKVRIAGAFLDDMKKRGCTAMIFYGDRCSNLCRVLANLCYIEQIPAVMIATASHDLKSGEPFNSRLITQFGVPILDCEASQIAETVDKAFAMLEDKGLKPYYIYGDRYGAGNEHVAARAYAAAYREITDIERAKGSDFDLIAVPYGTGATLSGLICGALENDSRRAVVGLSISSRTYDRAYGLLKEGIRGYFKNKNKVLPSDFEAVIRLETAYNKGGYGCYDSEVEAMIAAMMTKYGIPMDPTYTGKAFLALKSYLEEKGQAYKNVLFIHTGGTPLYFDFLADKT